MKLRLLILVGIAALSSAAWAAGPSVRLCQPWETEYAGQDATGPSVIALWQFSKGAETADASGRGHNLSLRGAKTVRSGRFGAAIESFPGWPVVDKRHQATATNHPSLSPKGAFTIEMWICPKAELNQDYPDAFLLDKKYVADTDYQLILGKANRYGSRTFRACLGFGDGSSTWSSRPVKLVGGVWRHVAFTYDGKGAGSFFIDGTPSGSEVFPARGAIAPGRHVLSIGDRIGSYYHGFPGLIDQVRISTGVLEFRRVALERISDRACFLRMESPAVLRFALTNLQPTPLGEGTVTIALNSMATRETKVADIPSGATVQIDYPLDTTLRPDEYVVTAELKVAKPQRIESRETFPVCIVPRRPPDQFPVVMWGVYGGVAQETDRLKRIGFTHVLGLGADYAKIFEEGEPTAASEPEKVASNKQMLDQCLADGLTVAASLSPGAAMRKRKRFQRIDRKGDHYGRGDVCGLFPRLREYCFNVGASMARTYGGFPGFGAAMIHTEVRGHAQPCFHEHDLEAFRKHAGIDIPPEVVGGRGVDYTRLKGFPTDRVIADDHPIYIYYKWYWKTGDGWNELNTALARGLKSLGRKDLWTWHDPAVRVASVHGSGGKVDYLSQWTYSYPDPIRIGLATDELFAMVAPRGGKQRVMKMTQIIWYRSQTAPKAKNPGDALTYKARWETEQPDAPFITIAPMHLREAFWTKIARPIRGIMYHGYQSLVPCEQRGGYRYTHSQTQDELARLIRQVVRPLGPTLLQVPGVKGDVALLESFASEMFARRGTYGWNGSWLGDVYHILQWAHVQPEIVFDETITKRGLEGFRVLVMPDCDVITKSMAERIKAFQAAGGLIVGDERIAPAIKPDIVIPVYKRTGRAKEDKVALQALAAGLRKKLDSHYTRTIDASSPDVVPYRRRYRDTDYVFVVNDHREYGDYVGQHGLVMENGLPSDAVLTVRRDGGVVYDLVSSRQVPARKLDDTLSIDVHLGPCDGRVYMVTPRPIEAVRIKAPTVVKRGTAAICTVEVVDGNGKPLEAVVPVEVAIHNTEGQPVEFSGAYAAVDGRVEITLDFASNDPPGMWRITARELASGRTASAYLRVLGPKLWPPERRAVPKGAASAVQPKG